MRIIFAGTPDFAVPGLARLIESNHDVVAVYTQPDRPSGRGKKLKPSPVKALAEVHDLEVMQPLKLQGDAVDTFAGFQADLAVVTAYGLILPKAVLDAPRLGCVNLHASLLPRWRGAAPINRAIEAGDTVTGITLMQMDAGLDTGDMLATRETPITDTTTAAQLHDTLAQLGADLLADSLDGIEHQKLQAVPQNDEDACYAHKLKKSESPVDWSEDAASINQKVRAFVPWPSPTTLHGEGDDETTLKIWMCSTESTDDDSPPGLVLESGSEGIRVATGRGQIVISELQRPGSRPMACGDFLNGYEIKPGDVLR